MLSLTVGHNGEDYWTIQEALDAVPYDEEAVVTVSEGLYEEKLFCDKRKLTLKGLGSVTVSWADGAREILPDGIKRGTFRTYTAFFSGQELRLENISFVNAAGRGKDVGQALALYLDVRRAELADVTLIGHQDTLFLAPLPEKEREKRGFYGPRVFSPRLSSTVYMHGGAVHGGVDFIFGGADALFEGVEIRSNEPGFVAAPSGDRDGIGFVFVDCSFTHEHLPEASVHLMRPWRAEGKAAFASSSYAGHIAPEGFIPWKGREDEADKATFLIDSPAYGGCESQREEILALADKIRSRFCQ